MLGSISRSARRERFRAALVRSLLAGVDPDSSRPEATLVFLERRLALLGGVARFVVSGVELLLSTAFAVAGGPGKDSARAEELLRRLSATELPVIGDYVRLARSLVVLFAYETRPPRVAARAGR